MPSIHPRLSLLASALLLVLVAVAAPLAARAADTCSLISKSQITAVTGDPVNSASPGPKDCIWSGKHSTIYITTRDSSTWATAKSAFQKYGQIESVSGVGSDAFFLGPDNPKPTLYALKGAHYIILRVNVTGFSADQTKAALKTLAGQALAGL